MVVLIDNYDSFVYNLARYIGRLGFARCVKRNDQITLSEIEALRPSHIVVSPGPMAPLQAGISMAVIQHFQTKVPILGVCLGHQAIGQVFGAKVVQAECPTHGKASWITHDGRGLFRNLENPLRAARYHSLIVSEKNFPEDLIVTARSEQNEIMAIEHRNFKIFGTQFHPESILTPSGEQLIANFLKA